MENNPDVYSRNTSKTDPVSVIADDRERGSGVIKALQEYDEVNIKIERLHTGDFIVDERLVFERKTLPDLAYSLVQGRFLSQAQRLARLPQRSVIVLEGTGRDIEALNVRREAIQGALINASVIMGLAILRSVDPQETARLMIYTARQVKRSIRDAVPRHGYRPKGRRKRQLFILQGLPGVGPKRAERLLEEFGTVEAVIKASAEQLAGVPGIGAKTAEELRSILCEEPAPYHIKATTHDGPSSGECLSASGAACPPNPP
jgi:ERCC4-type nuclease